MLESHTFFWQNFIYRHFLYTQIKLYCHWKRNYEHFSHACYNDLQFNRKCDCWR